VTPLMLHNCLDFNGGRFLKWYTQTAGAAKALSSAITNSAFTVIAAIYPQSIPTSAANVYDTDPILADYGHFWGLFLRDLSGVKQVAGYNWDGTADVIAMTITTGATWIVVFQHDGGNLKLSLIDASGTETSASNVASGNTTNLTNNLGLASTGGPSANFRIGEFAIWNTALTGGTDLADAKQYFKDSWTTAGAAGGFNALLIQP
jgi:hypothetical protein